MPAKPKATKRSAKVGAKAKAHDNKLYLEFEGPKAEAEYSKSPEPEERLFMRDFFYRRRHLAAGTNGLKYQMEVQEMDSITCDGLEKIYKRDGVEIGDEAAHDLLRELLKSIEWARGGSLPKLWRRMLKELLAEMYAQQAKDDARVRRQLRRADRPAIAA